jgi:hypothetical protein
MIFRRNGRFSSARISRRPKWRLVSRRLGMGPLGWERLPLAEGLIFNEQLDSFRS